MTADFATPTELVEVLQQGHRDARDALTRRLQEPLRRMLEALRSRRGLRHDLELVVRNLLHSLTAYLRSRPASEFASLSWDAFQAGLLVYAGRLALEPHAAPARADPAGPHDPPPGLPVLPECPGYDSAAFFLPYEQVGLNRFGGDWYAGRHAADGSLWVLVADVTGHGYYAYLLATSLPYLWSLCWEQARAPEHPAELLGRLHRCLEEALPEGVYVEATLACLRADGRVVVAPGGGSRVLVRDAAGCVTLHKLRGGWLGFMPPSPTDQVAWALDEGDEVLLSTDGLFDQMETGSSPALDWSRQLAGPKAGSGLLAGVRRLVEQVLRHEPQKDDITAVFLRRRRTH